jgi:hypothetical protein
MVSLGTKLSAFCDRAAARYASSTEAAGLLYDYKFSKNMSIAFRGISGDEERVVEKRH